MEIPGIRIQTDPQRFTETGVTVRLAENFISGPGTEEQLVSKVATSVDKNQANDYMVDQRIYFGQKHAYGDEIRPSFFGLHRTFS